MPSSLRRREGRLALGANKKIKVYSAEGNRIVEILVLDSPPSTRPLKASKGAERSSSRRRRGCRGLRKGKRRARGCHPRCSPIRQPHPTVDKSGPKSRVIRSHLRMCEWQRTLKDAFVQRIKLSIESGAFFPPRMEVRHSLQTRRSSLVVGRTWKAVQGRWERLHSYLSRHSSKFLADVALSHRFSAFVEDQLGISLAQAPGCESNASSFQSLLGRLGSEYRTSPQTNVGIECTGLLCTGTFCRTCGQRSFRGSPCPGKAMPITKSVNLGRGRPYPRR